MSADFDSNLASLRGMGFPDDLCVQALRLAKNDTAHAVLYLTGELTGLGEASNGNGNSIEQDEIIIEEAFSDDSPSEPGFPASSLRNLKKVIARGSPVYCQNEYLQRCIEAATIMIEEESFAASRLFEQFMEEVLPEVASRMVNANEINDLPPAQIRNIRVWSQRILSLYAARLRYLPITHRLSSVVDEMFCPDNAYHKHSRDRLPDPTVWALEGSSAQNNDEVRFADISSLKDDDHLHGSLVEFIEWFGRERGFEHMTEHFTRTNNPPSIQDVYFLIRPMFQILKFLKDSFVGEFAHDAVFCCVRLIEGLTDKMIRNRDVRQSVKIAIADCDRLYNYAQDLEVCLEQLRYDFLLKCMRSSQLESKMYALTELGELVCHYENHPDESDRFNEWLMKNNLLDNVLSGNMDQAAYVEKIKPVVQYMAQYFQEKEIAYVWSLRKGRMGVSGDNFGQLLLNVASCFNINQIAILIGFFNKCFQANETRMFDRIFFFCRDIGIQSKNQDVSEKMVSTMWEFLDKARNLQHSPQYGAQAHIELIDSLRRGRLREHYVRQLVERITNRQDEGNLVVHLVHLQGLLSIQPTVSVQGPISFPTSAIMTRRHANGFGQQDWDLDEEDNISRRQSIEELMTSSRLAEIVVEEVLRAREVATERLSMQGDFVIPALDEDSLSSDGDSQTTPCMIAVFGTFEYGRVLRCALEMLALLDSKGIDPLSTGRIDRLFHPIVQSVDSSDEERTVFFSWLTGVESLHTDGDALKQLLYAMCDLDVIKINAAAFDFIVFCIKRIVLHDKFGAVTECEWWNRALNYLWQILVESDDVDIVDKCTESLIQSMTERSDLSNEQKHLAFLENCNFRLDVLRRIYFDRQGEQVSPGSLLRRIQEIRTDRSESPQQSSRPCNADSDPKLDWERKVGRLSTDVLLRCIQRVLCLICEYVEKGDEEIKIIRNNIPHGNSFFGIPVDITLRYSDFIGGDRSTLELKTHSKETIFSLKTRIQQRLNLKNVRSISLYRVLPNPDNPDRPKELFVTNSHDWKTLEQLDIVPPAESGGFIARRRVEMVVKTRAQYNLSERGSIMGDSVIPGVMITKANGVFDMLHQLLSIGCEEIRAVCRRLLSLIPTDPASYTLFAKMRDDVTSAAAVLTHHLDMQQPYRLLYALESLFSRMLPVKAEQSHFRKAEELIAVGVNAGLPSLLLDILARPHLLPPIPNKDRMCIFEITHAILAYLLLGDCRLKDQLRNEKRAGRDTAINFPEQGSILLTEEAIVDTVRRLRQYAWNAVGGWLLKPGVPTNGDDPSCPLLLQSPVPTAGCSFWAGGDSHPQVLTTSPHTAITADPPNRLTEREVHLSREAIHLLLRFTEQRVVLLEGVDFAWSAVWNENGCHEFWTDILVNSPYRKQIREAACRDLERTIREQTDARRAVLRCLVGVRAKSTYWDTKGDTKFTMLQQRQRVQCESFFTLLAEALGAESCTASLIESTSISLGDWLEEEVKWLMEFRPTGSLMNEPETAVASGHMLLMFHLVGRLPLRMNDVGSRLLAPLLSHCLFNQSLPNEVLSKTSMLCPIPDGEARFRAIRLVQILCSQSSSNTVEVIKWLSQVQERVRLENWENEVLTTVRQCAHVGLKNDGGTCYMNSVLQQLFFIPSIAKRAIAIKGIDPNCKFDDAKGALLLELQRIFAHLAFSEKEYYIPRGFWNTFRFTDEERLDTKMQHDAFDFFTAIVDKCDTVLEKLKQPLLFKPILGGKFQYEYICHGCWHRTVGREEEFNCVNLELHGDSLEECFEHYVDGEILEGDNAYKCGVCDEKRPTLRRGAFHSLPDTLSIQLKRFSYDWGGRQARKNDQFCAFPEQLDMTPFTTESRKVGDDDLEELFEAVCESSSQSASCSSTKASLSCSGVVPHPSPSVSRLSCGVSPAPSPNSSFARLNSRQQQRRRRISTMQAKEQFRYELVGVLAHHGLAAAGHYYSFIKERKAVHGSFWHGRWLEANDTKMADFMTEGEDRANQWFGGTYREERVRANSINGHVELPKERTRSWNAYILFYDRVREDAVGADQGEKAGCDEDVKGSCDSVLSNDHLKAMFDSMPEQLKREVDGENNLFHTERVLYNQGYIDMCNNLVESYVKRLSLHLHMLPGVTEPILTDEQEREFLPVAKFYMRWCVHVLWRFSDALCPPRVVEFSAKLVRDMVRMSQDAALELLDIVTEERNVPGSWPAVFSDLCFAMKLSVRTQWWDKIMHYWMRSLADYAETTRCRLPQLMTGDQFDNVFLLTLNHIKDNLLLHRLRPEAVIGFFRRFLIDSWKRQFFVSCDGLQIVGSIIYYGSIDEKQDGVLMTQFFEDLPPDRRRELAEIYVMLLNTACKSSIRRAEEFVFMYNNRGQNWKILFELAITFYDDSEILRKDFCDFASHSLLHYHEFLVPFVDGVSLISELCTKTEHYISLLYLLFSIDAEYHAGGGDQGAVFSAAMRCPHDDRLGLLVRARLWVYRSPLRVGDLVKAFGSLPYDDGVSECAFSVVQPFFDEIGGLKKMVEDIRQSAGRQTGGSGSADNPDGRRPPATSSLGSVPVRITQSATAYVRPSIPVEIDEEEEDVEEVLEGMDGEVDGEVDEDMEANRSIKTAASMSPLPSVIEMSASSNSEDGSGSREGDNE